MAVKIRFFAVAATSLVALGGCAAPALASGHSPVVASVERLQPTLVQNVGSIDGAANQRKVTAVLLANAKTCQQAADTVDHLTASPVQQVGQREWVKGVRLQAAGDQQFAAGVRAILSGSRREGQREVDAGADTLDRADGDVSRGDKLLGIFRAIAKLDGN